MNLEVNSVNLQIYLFKLTTNLRLENSPHHEIFRDIRYELYVLQGLMINTNKTPKTGTAPNALVTHAM